MRACLFALVSSLTLALPVTAQPVDPNGNVRPVTVNNATGGELSLSQILNGSGSNPPLFTGYTFDVLNDQQRTGLWGSSSPSVGSTIPTLVVEYAGFSAINKFGIWFGTDPSNVVTYELLLGPATSNTAAGVFIGNGTLSVFAASSDCGIRVGCGYFTNSLINASMFGFYFQTGNGSRVYSLDALNTNNEARFLSYQAGQTTNWAFAYEDIAFANGSDRDYNDMVVKVESVFAVPEPSTWALMLAGLAALGFALRRRM
jgi:hypothetical protein